MPAFLPRIFRNPPAVVAFVFPILILVGNKLLSGAVVALAVAVLIWWRPASWRAALPFAAILGLLALWGAISVIWSITPALSVERAARFAGLAICGLAICQGARGGRVADQGAVASGLLAGLAVAACLSIAGLAWQNFSGNSFLPAFNHKPLSTVGAVLLFPAAGALCANGRYRIAAVGGAVLMALFLGSDSLAAVVAAVAGVVVFAIVYFGRRRAAHAISAALVAAVLVGPAIVVWSDSPSWIQDSRIQLRHSAAHRIVVWDFVGQRIMARPFLGWGIGVARNIPGAGANPLDQPRYRDMLLSSRISPKSELQALPLHPHNAVLHMWLELGPVGLLLYLALCVMCLRQVIRGLPDRIALAAGTATVTAAIVIGQVSFSVWQSWWIAAQFMVAAILLALSRT